VRSVRFSDATPTGLDWQALEIGWRPGWCGVEQLDHPPLDLLTSVALPSLRVLGCDRERVAAAVDASVDLTDLDILALYRWFGRGQHPGRGDAERVRGLIGAPGLRGLRQLKLHCYADDRAQLDRVAGALAPVFAQPHGLHTLTVSTDARDWHWVPAPAWLAALRDTKSSLRRLRADGSAGERWIFEHATAGIDWQRIRVEWWGSNPNLFTADRVLDVIRAGAPAITVVARAQLSPAIEARLRSVPCELTLEVDSTLTLDRLET
jgi:hypothetical protein